MNELVIFQNNINGFYSKAQLLETNLHAVQPHICLLQECFRSENRRTINDQQLRNLYNQFWSETGRTGILCRADIHVTQRAFGNHQDKFQRLGYKSCWVEMRLPTQRKPVMLCSFYRNLHKTKVLYSVNEEDQIAPALLSFDLKSFEKELTAARDISEHILIGGDWNAHHPAWLDEEADEIGESVLEFIVNNEHS
jgi:exonuclease III